MRNLKLVSNSICNVNTQDGHLCIDPVTGRKYVVNAEGLFEVKGFEGSGSPLKKWVEFDVEVKNIISAEFIPMLNSICVTTLGGDVICANLEDSTVEVVGCVTDGIIASSWSPDQELLALVTSEFNVVLMTVDFEHVSELSLNLDNFGEKEFINVGWGRKETQFHGSEGKQAAKITSKPVSTVFEWDDRKAKISWRGDAQLFVVSYVNSSDIRKLRIISNKGVIQSTSEDIEGLEDCLCWKPSGSLITTSQKLSNKHNIVFFEKNGLQHGSFTLPFNSLEMKIISVMWNMDSTVLLVWLKPFNVNNKSYVQLWKTENYHWYLKEEFVFCDEIFHIKWDAESPLILYILFSSKVYSLQFVNSVDCSTGTTSNDLTQVAVVDGKKLLITPFSQAVVPPPMSAYEVSFPDQVHSVIFAPNKNEKLEAHAKAIEDSGFLDTNDALGSNSNNLCVYHGEKKLTFLIQASPQEQLSDCGITISITGIGGNGFIAKSFVHRVFAQFEVEFKDSDYNFSPSTVYNWSWMSKNTIIACAKKDLTQNYIIVFDIDGIGIEGDTLYVNNLIEIEKEIRSISTAPCGSVCLQLVTGDLLKLNLEDFSLTHWMENDMDSKFPTPCDHVYICPGNEFIPLGLTSRNGLYLNEKLLISNCTSVHMHSDHVLLTTTTHDLLIVPSKKKELLSLSFKNEAELYQIGIRKLERGSKIVTTVSDDTRVLLQLPRGNLEMINPRPLVVHKIKMLLDKRNYLQVINIMRKHRLDMNLIYDHNPKEFLTYVKDFVTDVNNPQYIDLFISSLKEIDVTQSSYSSNYKGIVFPSKGNFYENKVDKILSSLRSAMESIDENKYLLPILSSYVHSSDRNVEMAILKLRHMRKDIEEVNPRFEAGLRHIMYVCDANELLDIALGTYDFDLVMMIFEKSQKDPKEYLPFFNGLLKLETNYQHFKINVHLKRYLKAFECANNIAEEYHQECLDLIVKEKLYQEAIGAFKDGSRLQALTYNLYGDYLTSKGFNDEAALMYECGGNLENALKIYVEINKWKKAFALAFRLQYNRSSLVRLYRSQAQKLMDKCCFTDAGVIFDKYLESEEEAVNCYCKGFLWEDAFLVASKYGRDDLINTDLKTSLLDHQKTIENEIAEIKNNFNELFSRLKIVRVTKRNEYQDFLDGKFENPLNADICDGSTVTGFTNQWSAMSNAMTGITLGSSRTYRSSKNKRKLDRKKYSSKEGSFFEDLGLVVELHTTITKALDIAKPILELNKFLIYFKEQQGAKLLQTSFHHLIEEMKKRKFEIWVNCAPLDEENVEFGPEMTTETIAHKIQNAEKEKEFLIQRMNILETDSRFPPNLDKIPNFKLVSLK